MLLFAGARVWASVCICVCATSSLSAKKKEGRDLQSAEHLPSSETAAVSCVPHENAGRAL